MKNLKPLGYFANLPQPIETTELSQPQLRELIARLLSVSAQSWRYEPHFCPPSFPAWVEKNWDTLLADPSGVARWAAQYLQNEQNAMGGLST